MSPQHHIAPGKSPRSRGISLLAPLLLVLLMAGLPVAGQAQLSLQVLPHPNQDRPETPALSKVPGLSPQILPAYALENPTGYSFLCRLELDIERKAPIGVWMKIEESSLGEGLVNSRAYLRLKVLDF